jgi:2-desacetyl-2-hydroxyethyl bacteriochlorophyllide A dehydrogenase
MRARRVTFTAPRQVALEPVDVGAPGPGQVQVRTQFSGISGGTELLAYRGLIDPDLPLDERIGALGGTFRHPFPYGYSCVGQVEAGSLPVGTTVFAFSPHQDVLLLDEADAVVLPDGTPPREATLFPSVETALQLSLDAGPVAHERVVVLGLGVVGLLTALLLQRAGARVVAADPVEPRRAIAASVGIAAVAPGDLPTGVPLVVELSGSPSALPRALDLLAHEGTALVGSWYGRQDVVLPLGGAFHRRRLTIRSSQVSTIPAALAARWDHARRRAAAAALLADLPLAALATTEVRFDDIARAYALLDDGTAGVLHVALRYQ